LERPRCRGAGLVEAGCLTAEASITGEEPLEIKAIE